MPFRSWVARSVSAMVCLDRVVEPWNSSTAAAGRLGQRAVRPAPQRGRPEPSRGAPCYDRFVAFARWDPFRDLLAIQHRIERLSAAGPQGWVPAVDLCETSDAFIVTAELPGVTRDQIRIDVHDGRLTLHGRRDARVACEHYHQVERGHGEFCRSFRLPHVGRRGPYRGRAEGRRADHHRARRARAGPPPRRRLLASQPLRCEQLSLASCWWPLVWRRASPQSRAGDTVGAASLSSACRWA